MTYAGFWKRFAAFFIDCALFFCFMLAFEGVLASVMGLTFVGYMEGAINPEVTLTSVEVIIYLIEGIIFGIYFACFESSSKQATPGKMALGIKVTDLQGRSVGFGKAIGRYFGKYISQIFLLGFIMVAFTRKKQGLHDMMAGCLVVKK